MFFYASVATLASYGTDDFSAILEEFTKFSSTCERIVGTTEKEKAELLEKYPAANVSNWYLH